VKTIPASAIDSPESRYLSRARKSNRPILLCCSSKEAFTISHIIRLELMGRVTHYIGWIALLCGGLVHLNIARTLFLTANLTKRNLFEVSVVFFLICIASELRAHALPANEMPVIVEKAA